MGSSNLTPIPIQSKPGIQRDGTLLAGDGYVDGIWTRFQRGLPRKMHGYRQVTPTLPEVPYGMRADLKGSSIYLHIGSASKLTQVVTDQQGLFSNQFDRTPVGFFPDTSHVWGLDTYQETLGGTLQIIGAAPRTLIDIASDVEVPIYYGDLAGSAPLAQAFSGDPEPLVSGGVVSLWPFFMGYGSDGTVKWTAPNDLTVWNTTYHVSGSKIVKGMPLRGNSTGPAVILWSLTDVIQGQYIGVDPALPTNHVFRFSTLATQSSVLSSQGIIDYGGVYYWVGVDSFMMFNGVVTEVPNNMNINWFFDT